MKFHIVQVNERAQDISKKYNVSLEEIVKLNRHINNIDSIVPGMKIRLPILSDEVSDELKDNFLDIEKYYPKVADFKDAEIEKKNVDEKEKIELDEEKPIENNKPVESIEIPQQPYYGQQTYPYQPYPQQQMYQPQYYQTQYLQQPQQSYPYQQNYHYYQPPVQNRELNQQLPNVKKEVPKEENQVDLTIPYLKETCPNIEQKFFEQPAFCDPNLLRSLNQTKSNDISSSIYQPFFQNPLFNPPYPCGGPIEEIDKDIRSFEKRKIENGFDEDVKEIKLDLRGYIKKHTKVSKKKDTLDLL